MGGETGAKLERGAAVAWLLEWPDGSGGWDRWGVTTDPKHAQYLRDRGHFRVTPLCRREEAGG